MHALVQHPKIQKENEAGKGAFLSARRRTVAKPIWMHRREPLAIATAFINANP